MADRDAAVRVDHTGTIHPVGRAASQELRARPGELRLVPCPANVLLFCAGAATLRVAGEIKAPGALYDIVSLITQAQWRGALHVEAEAGARTVYFDQGVVLGAVTTVPDERLGEILYRFGVLTREQLDHIVTASSRTGKRLGESAIELDFVKAGTLFPMMARQVEEVLYGALQVAEGSFFFFDGFEENSLVQRHQLSASALLMEGARRVDEMRYFRERVPNGSYVPVPVPGKRPPEELLAVFEKCDGKASVSEIGRLVGQLEFEVTRAMFQLTSGGYVHLSASRPRGPEAIIEVFNPALAAVHQSCDAADRGAQLREGLAQFATGGGMYDPLFMGAGPAVDGTLSADRLARNVAALAGDDPDAWLVSLMDDYTNFALFQAESLISRAEVDALLQVVKRYLAPLRGANTWASEP